MVVLLSRGWISDLIFVLAVGLDSEASCFVRFDVALISFLVGFVLVESFVVVIVVVVVEGLVFFVWSPFVVGLFFVFVVGFASLVVFIVGLSFVVLYLQFGMWYGEREIGHT